VSQIQESAPKFAGPDISAVAYSSQVALAA
jgi:hypothetical protein